MFLLINSMPCILMYLMYSHVSLPWPPFLRIFSHPSSKFARETEDALFSELTRAPFSSFANSRTRAHVITCLNMSTLSNQV